MLNVNESQNVVKMLAFHDKYALSEKFRWYEQSSSESVNRESELMICEYRPALEQLGLCK